ncbi:MAG: hypothetical protein LBH09_06245 [Peptococcaceae bacterium]|nr:hypothetical protein [Peptococcaceae bacterium]
MFIRAFVVFVSVFSQDKAEEEGILVSGMATDDNAGMITVADPMWSDFKMITVADPMWSDHRDCGKQATKTAKWGYEYSF